MNKNKVLSLIGLSMKAGKIASGEFATEKAVKTGKAYLVVVAAEALTIPEKNFAICVSIIRFLFMNLVRKQSWATR